MIIDALKAKQYKNTYKTKNKKKEQKDDADINKTLKGVLINNYKKNTADEAGISFDEIQDSLLICENPKYYHIPEDNKVVERESAFDAKKALVPLLAGTGILLAGFLGVSSVLQKSSKTILNTKSFEHLPDLAVNMNIKEEPHFALYRAIRDPNFRNIIGAAAVFIMSGITLISKNFVEGAKEVWIKKKSADIEKDLQEDLIEVETKSFSGKLNVVNNMLSRNVKYFDEVLNNRKEKAATPAIFSGFMAFRGAQQQEDNTQSKENIDKKDLKKNIKFLALVGAVLIGALAVGKLSLSNLKKTAQNADRFANNITEATIDTIKGLSENPNSNDIPRITELLKAICAKPEFVKEIGKKYKLSDSEVQTIINAVDETKRTIFADAPTALGGIPKKVQYYCYIDENRGHLYNWILNPENKFTKYIFYSFTITSAIGYLFKQSVDAIKEVAVLKENAKTELDLRKRLVDVEIRNFKSKKESAINPLVDNFTKQAQSGTKTKDDLKQLADNILTETKNGPPYVYT